MKVLLVAHYLLPHSGGIEVLVDREARLLAGAGHEVVVLVSDAGEGEPPRYPAGVRICRVPAWNGLERFQVPWPVFSPRLAPLLWQQIRWCDVVHVNGLLYVNCFLALLFARILGKRTLLTEHAGLAWYPLGFKRVLQRFAMELLGRASARLADRCIGHHERVVALLHRLAGPSRRVTYVPTLAVDRTLFRPPHSEERRKTRAELGWENGRPKVLFVGRLIKRKGIDLLIRAKDPRYDLVFCGPGDLSLLGEVHGNGVSYLPPRSQVGLVSLYHAADVLALPSRSEGALVLVAQEALACGLPVLLSEDLGLPRYRRCAGLYFCALTPEAIRQRLLEILQRRPVPVTALPGEALLDDLLPNDMAWLEEVYG